MFHRVLYENWHNLVPIVAFVLTFAVFLVAFIRALLMRKDTVAAMALLPLDEVAVQIQPEVIPSVIGKAGVAAPGREPCQGNCTDCCCERTK